MAVNNSIISRVCLYCKEESDKDFQDICDEVGLELQLPTLVERFFYIKVKNDDNKYLCEDCVNRLIEFYDFEEHEKEKIFKAVEGEISKNKVVYKDIKTEHTVDTANFLRTEPESSNKDSCGIYLKRENCQLEDNVIHSVSHTSQNVLQRCNPFRNLEVSSVTSNHKSIAITTAQIQTDNDIDESLQKKIEIAVVSENEESEYVNKLTTLNRVIEVSNVIENECNEHIEFIEDDEDSNIELENINTNTLIDTEELENLRQSEMHQVVYTDSEKDISNLSSQNDIVVDNIYEEDLDTTLINSNENISQTENKDEIDVDNIFIDESGNVYYEEDIPISELTYCSNEINIDEERRNAKLTSPDQEIQKNVKTVTVLYNSSEAEVQSCETEDCNTAKNKVTDQDEDSKDSFSLEEEYLIEEINCSTEYDEINLNEYLDKVLATKFQDLQLNWDTECKLCCNNFNTLEDLLSHSCVSALEDGEQFNCIIKDCEEIINNLPTLARHLILRHFDKLESVSIYGKCPDCQKTFSTIIDFNKHSCCRNIKRKTGSPNYCQYCDMGFQSLKRYVFHMQFHLTNRRPKICLLCGDLFNNSNDFFEHTQYHHVPETSMACIKCDRFFVKKEVFANHMELHKDSKYQYKCSLCPKKYTNKFGLNQHMDIYHNNKSNALHCNHCEKEFVNKTSYRNHIKCHEGDVQVETYICSKCGIISNNTKFITNHTEGDEDSPCFESTIEEETLGVCYTCENCSLDFYSIKHLKMHRISDIHNDELYNCVICRQSFKSLRHMRNHSITHKNFKEWQEAFPITRFFVCNIGNCQEFYPIWTSLYYHKKRPHKSEENAVSPTKFKCQFCQQLCSSKMSLAVHVTRSHNNSNVKCPHCKRGFKHQKLLQDHIDHYHTPVKCEICFKKFKHRRNLISHNNMVHLNIKRYFCKYCEKGYFHKSEKEIHEKKVHPAVTYKCEICNFVTNYPESLEIHMDKHNNQLKFQCLICRKQFGRKQLLKCHMKMHSNKRDFNCATYLKGNGCDKDFNSYNLLKRHIQSKHPNSSYSINMQRDNELKKSVNKCPETQKIEYISCEISECDEDSKQMETDFEEATFEMVYVTDAE